LLPELRHDDDDDDDDDENVLFLIDTSYSLVVLV